MNDNLPRSSQTPDTRKRKIALGIGGGLLALFGCCCLAVIVLFVIDPFKLNLIGRLRGGYDAPATVMPADTELYMSVNLLNLRSEKANRIVAAFAEQAKEANVSDTDSLIKQIDESMQDKIGMTLTDDVMPWIGQYAGFGFTHLTMSQYGSLEKADWIAAVEARDTKAADNFLQKLKNNLADSMDISPSEDKYQGVNITEINSQVAFARSERLVIFGANASSVRAAIDAQKSGSLSTQPTYKDLAKQLPGERAITLYVNGSQFQDALKGLAGSTLGNLPSSVSMTNLGEAVVSLSIVDAGVQLDTVYAYDTAGLSEEQKALMDASGADPRTDDLFPEGTVLFLKGQRLDLVWKAYRQVLGDSLGSSDFDEAMNMFEQQYGFNPDSDLFPYLNGEWAIGLMPSSEGLLAKSANVNLGFALLAETDNPGALRTTVDSLRPKLEGQGASFRESESGGIKFTQLEASGETVAAYCVSDRYLALGSTSQSLQNMFTGSNPLSKSSRYSQVWQAFPRGMSPVFYLDIEGIMGLLRQSLGSSDEATRFLTPIKYFALASSPLRSSVGKSTMILFIPTE